jgi:FixJ family two-component response regulator
MIYLIEDDAAVRDALQAMLEAEGHEITAFASGEAFLAAIDGTHSGCAVIDVHMPGVDGFQLMDRLQALGADLPVILMTGNPTPRMHTQAQKRGAIALLEKPFDPAELFRAMAGAPGVESNS